MNKLYLTKVPKLKPNPLFKGMSKSLRDPKNYEETKKKLLDILKTDHPHRTPSSYMKCSECQSKFQERKRLMKEVGFKSYHQYLEWDKIHTIIKNKVNFQLG